MHEMVQMPDSVHLATEVYLPADTGAFTAVLIRTPYTGRWLGDVANRFAESGYATVIQYVRGMNGSEGQFFPFVHERGDGLATLDWITQQPWSDGSVGIWGASYLSYCGFELASIGHPSLEAMINVSGWADMNAFMTRGGAFRLLDHLPWFIIQMSGNGDIPEEAWGEIFRTTPLKQLFRGADEHMSGVFGEPYPFESVNIPILHITGWNDYLYRSTLLAYSSIHGTVSDDNEQRIIIGPWTHNQMFSTEDMSFGDEEFGQSSVMGLDSILKLTVAWFDEHIRGGSGNAARIPGATYFVMNENRWATSDHWPPSSVTFREMHLSGSGKPGLLADERPSAESTASFAYNPEDPAPTIGGVGGNLVQNIGIKDQSPVAERRDVLAFESAPFDKGLSLAGPITAVIYASTDGIDTDFTAKLVEVRYDG
jgi:predicted acyl esterase